MSAASCPLVSYVILHFLGGENATFKRRHLPSAAMLALLPVVAADLVSSEGEVLFELNASLDTTDPVQRMKVNAQLADRHSADIEAIWRVINIAYLPQVQMAN